MNEESLFAAALEKANPAERHAFLDQACGNDRKLRQRLERLLAADEHTSGLLSRGAAGLLESGGATLAAGNVLAGRFKLRQLLGTGGMGEVWVADQHEPVQRRIALKLIRPGLDSARLIARFEQERQALALMDHPNIARVLDAGTTEGGRPYFVMELIKGVPITEYCDTTRLSPRQRLELFVPVCQAVQHAHQKGIIHRDLKPSNVLVALYDGQPAVKVIDFGIAKATGERLSEHSVYTEVGVLVGTLEYMSPEQAEVNNLDIDTRSDIYALGVLLYELLTGSVPHSRKELRSVPFAEMLRIIKEVEPPRPSTKLLSESETLPAVAAARQTEPKKLSALVQGELDWIVMKCLEKDRGRRYETANALALDVERYLSNESVLACPPSAPYRLRKFVQRNKRMLAIAACVLLTVAVMAASIGWAVRDRAARRTEVEQAEIVRRTKVEGQVRDSLNAARTLIAENNLAAAREKLVLARAQLGNDGPALGDLGAKVEAGTAELDRFQQFRERIERAHQAETASRLETMLTADGSGGRAGRPASVGIVGRRPAAAVPYLLEAFQCYAVLENDNWTSTLEGGLLGTRQVEQTRRLAYEELLWLADDIIRRKQAHGAERTLAPEMAAQQALDYMGKAERAHRPTLALYTLRARCRKLLGDEAAAQADSQLATTTPPTMAVDHYLRGQAALEARQLDAGVQAFEAALRLEPTHYWSMMKLGYCLCDLGQGPDDFAGATRVFTGCILSRPDHAHAFDCRGFAYSKLGRYENAVLDYSRAIELGANHAQTWLGRGVAYDELGQPDRALLDFSKVIELDPSHTTGWNNRGVVYNRLDQPDKAVLDCSKAIELDPNYAPAWKNRGWAYNLLEQWEKAIADCSRAIELDPTLTPAWSSRGIAHRKLRHFDHSVADHSRAIELSPRVAQSWNHRGDTFHDLLQWDKALADYSKAIELDPKYTTAWDNRAIVHSRLRQWNKAIADFSTAIELKPEVARVWVNRGWAYHLMRQPEKAIADSSRAIELDPKFTVAWHNRGVIYGQLGQWDKAVADQSKVIELNPKFLLAWNKRGEAYNDLGQPDKAVADFARVIELNPKFASAWHNRGLAYSKLSQWNEAVADFSKAIELNPRDASTWYNRGLAFNRLGQPDKGIADCSRGIELDPKDARAWYNRGVIYGQLGRLEKAVVDYSKVLELNPKHPRAWNNRGWAYKELGQSDKALVDYSRAIDLDPKFALAWKNRAILYDKLDQPHKAVADWLKVVELTPKEADSWKQLGVAHYHVGDWKAAVVGLEKSLGLRPGGDGASWLVLAMAHWNLGNHDMACMAYEQAAQWLELNRETLQKDKKQAEEIRRLRAEAEVILQRK